MRDLRPDLSLPDVADDLYFLQVRLEARVATQHLAPLAAALLAQVDTAIAEHRAHRRAIVRADAQAGSARQQLEEAVTTLGQHVLVAAGLDRDSALYRTWLPSAPSELTGGTRAELVAFVQGAEARAGASDLPQLRDQGPLLASARAGLEAASESQRQADDALRSHTTAAREPLRTAANDLRRGLFADLEKLRLAAKQPRRWTESFFRQQAKQKVAVVV